MRYSTLSPASCLVACALILLVAGCAPPAAVQRFGDQAQSTSRYDAFVAYGAFKDLAVEGRFEKTMCRALRRARHACTPMLALAPPTRPQTGASRQRAAAHSGAQATLVIELADPGTASRRLLADGRPGFRVSVVDIASQRVAARLAIDPSRRADTLAARADAVARATVSALGEGHLLRPR